MQNRLRILGVLTSIQQLDLRDPEVVIQTLRAGERANLEASCRSGSIDQVKAQPEDRLIATGDLHDHTVHLLRLTTAAGMVDDAQHSPAHLTLHELIHSDRLINGMDYSYRMLTRVAALKAAFPEHIHALLANHEIAQATGGRVGKEGVDCVLVFNDAIEHIFMDDAPRVQEAINAFILSMPLAVIFELNSKLQRRILCAHALPAPELMERFDPGILERAMVIEDFVPRQGSAHLMTWGRGHSAEQVELLARRWNVDRFILGHEKAEEGSMVICERAIVLNSDHERGVYLPVELDGNGELPGAGEWANSCIPLGHS